MRDPPVNPEHDVDEPEPIRQARGRDNADPQPADDPSPEKVLYDESRVPG